MDAGKIGFLFLVNELPRGYSLIRRKYETMA